MNKKSLLKVVSENTLCLQDNPFGIERSWPKSYIKNFYEDFCNELYYHNKSPNILEINQKNNINLKLWKIFFDDPNIHNPTIETIMNTNYKSTIKYDLIIINNLNIKFDIKILNKLIKLLKSEGILVIENIGRESKKVMMIYYFLYLKYNLEIKDFRINRFILNNCLLIICKKKQNIFYKIKGLISFFSLIFFENLISFTFFLLRK